MRQLNTFIAGLVFAILVTIPDSEAWALEPFQQQALDKILTSVDAASRPILQAQIEPMLATMNQAQVEVLLTSYPETGTSDYNEDEQDDPADVMATPADLEFNRVQYEPVIRSAWHAQKSFDDFVTTRLKSLCGQRGEYAVFGAGWRYEVFPLDPAWPRASNSDELDVHVISQSYAPQDGRYRFDFSEVRLDFDKAATEAAISTACREYKEIGQAFMEAASKGLQDGLWPGGFDMENQARGRVEQPRKILEAQLQQLAPSGNTALFTALLNGEPVMQGG